MYQVATNTEYIGLSLRIRGVKTELEDAGLDAEGMAETTSQLQAKIKALTDGKVDVMFDENNFKNTTEILREMSQVWEDMTDKEQANCCLYVQKCA